MWQGCAGPHHLRACLQAVASNHLGEASRLVFSVPSVSKPCLLPQGGQIHSHPGRARNLRHRTGPQLHLSLRN